jgi:hypothetical protein
VIYEASTIDKSYNLALEDNFPCSVNNVDMATGHQPSLGLEPGNPPQMLQVLDVNPSPMFFCEGKGNLY